MRLIQIAFLSIVVMLFSACSNEGAWVEYHNTDFNYTALFPEEPNVENTDINLPVGKVPSQGVSAYEHPTETQKHLFMINCITFPNTIVEDGNIAAREALFSNVVTQLLNDSNGKLVYERAIEVDGVPARAFRIEHNASDKEVAKYVTYQTFVKDKVQFILQAITAKKEENEASVEQFMNSFKFAEVE